MYVGKHSHLQKQIDMIHQLHTHSIVHACYSIDHYVTSQTNTLGHTLQFSEQVQRHARHDMVRMLMSCN